MLKIIGGAAIASALALGTLAGAAPAFADSGGNGAGVQQQDCTLLFPGGPYTGGGQIVTAPSGNTNLHCHTSGGTGTTSGGAMQQAGPCFLLVNGVSSSGNGRYVITPSGNANYHCHTK
jgi:hypothetical protein